MKTDFKNETETPIVPLLYNVRQAIVQRQLDLRPTRSFDELTTIDHGFKFTGLNN